MLEMERIANKVEFIKAKNRFTETVVGNLGEHFAECLCVNPNTRGGPVPCLCRDNQHYQSDFMKLFKDLNWDDCENDTSNRLLDILNGRESYILPHPLFDIAKETSMDNRLGRCTNNLRLLCHIFLFSLGLLVAYTVMYV